MTGQATTDAVVADLHQGKQLASASASLKSCMGVAIAHADAANAPFSPPLSFSHLRVERQLPWSGCVWGTADEAVRVPG